MTEEQGLPETTAPADAEPTETTEEEPAVEDTKNTPIDEPVPDSATDDGTSEEVTEEK